MTEFQHKRVPIFVFVRNRDQQSPEYAYVLALSAKDFVLKDLVPQDSGPIKVRALQDVEGATYLVFYTSDRLESFFLPAVNHPGAHSLRMSGARPVSLLPRAENHPGGVRL
jgi:hypothetical protein